MWTHDEAGLVHEDIVSSRIDVVIVVSALHCVAARFLFFCQTNVHITDLPSVFVSKRGIQCNRNEAIVSWKAQRTLPTNRYTAIKIHVSAMYDLFTKIQSTACIHYCHHKEMIASHFGLEHMILSCLIITGPPTHSVGVSIFCSLASVVVCNTPRRSICNVTQQGQHATAD